MSCCNTPKAVAHRNDIFLTRAALCLVGLVFVFSISLTGPARLSASQGAAGLTLEQAVLLAIKNNPDISTLSSRYKALQNVPSQQGSLPDPVLSFSALNLPTDSFSLDQEAMTQMQVKITQAIPFPGKLSLKEKAAVKEARAAGFRLQELQLSVAARVETA